MITISKRKLLLGLIAVALWGVVCGQVMERLSAFAQSVPDKVVLDLTRDVQRLTNALETETHLYKECARQLRAKTF